MAPLAERMGFWGQVTSTLDWCEENYLVSHYIAEFWNTLSNWIMIIPPLLGALLTYRHNMEKRYTMSFLALSVVGLGSLCFHATLLYEMQLLDELPMIYGTCVFIFCMAEVSFKPGTHNRTLIIFLITCSVFITLVYVSVVNPLIFQWAYGVLAGTLTAQGLYNCKKYSGSWRLCALSLISYGSGFILWNIDNNYCPPLRILRDHLLWPLQPLFQLHAVWHTLAGIGSYYHILYSLHLRMKLLGKAPVVQACWGCLPFVYTSWAEENGNKPSGSSYSAATSRPISLPLFQSLFAGVSSKLQLKKSYYQMF